MCAASLATVFCFVRSLHLDLLCTCISDPVNLANIVAITARASPLTLHCREKNFKRCRKPRHFFLHKKRFGLQIGFRAISDSAGLFREQVAVARGDQPGCHLSRVHFISKKQHVPSVFALKTGCNECFRGLCVHVLPVLPVILQVIIKCAYGKWHPERAWPRASDSFGLHLPVKESKIKEQQSKIKEQQSFAS